MPLLHNLIEVPGCWADDDSWWFESYLDLSHLRHVYAITLITSQTLKTFGHLTNLISWLLQNCEHSEWLHTNKTANNWQHVKEWKIVPGSFMRDYPNTLENHGISFFMSLFVY